MTYTDWLPAAKCQLNCKCLAEAGQAGRLLAEGAALSLFFFLRHVLTRLYFFLLPPRAGNPHALLEDSCPPFPADGAPRERGGGAGSGLWPLPRALGLLEGLSLFARWHGAIPENSPEILAGDSWCDLEHTPSAPLRPGFLRRPRGLEGDGGWGPLSGCAEGARSAESQTFTGRRLCAGSCVGTG